MSTKSSIAPIMAWNWVVQSLAKFKQVDPSTLTGVVKKTPAISNDLGKDSREIVSLRILENMFIHGNEDAIDINSTQNSKISFDPSEKCEDVLNRLLEETSEPMTELERQKWNVAPFVMHKKATLPKSPLQKLKEELLETSHPLFVSLKEKCNLEVTNLPENSQNSQSTCPEVNINFNDQTTGYNNDLVSMNTEKESNKLPKCPSQKPDHVEENMSMDHDDQTTSKNLEHSCDNVNIDHGQQELTGQDTCRNEHDKRVLTDNSTDPQNDILPNISNIDPSDDERKNMEENTDNEKSDDDDNDDEMTEIAAMKEAFLNCQYTQSQDSMTTIDFTEISLCMKCNKSGDLLVCNSDTCQLRVHDTCLNLTTTFDKNGIFFCPFCAYSNAISKYLEAKKKASLARKDLQSFIGSGVKHIPEIPLEKGVDLDKEKSTDEEKSTEIEAVKRIPEIPLKKGANLDKEKSRYKEKSTETEAVKHIPEIPLKKGADLDKEKSTETEAASQKVKVNGKEGCVPNENKRKCRQQKPQYTSPTIPLTRRKILQWTKSEVEILKEGMRKYSSDDNSKIPWRDILEFGREVFHKSRTTIDLKDKWRNICKGSPVKKKQKL